MVETTQTIPARLAQDAHRYELTLGDYWRILKKRRLIIVFTFVSILAGTIAYTNLQTPYYQASSSLRIVQKARAFQYDVGFFNSPLSDPLASISHRTTSKDVMERVVLRLGLLNPDATAADLAEKVGEISGAISTNPVGTTDIIQITVTYPNPELAASIANYTAEEFIKVDMLESSRSARSLRQFIEKQLAHFTDVLKKTEEQIRSFRAAGRAFGIAAGLDQRLNDLEKERNLLLKQFTEKHPDVIKVDDQIGAIRDRIKKLPADEIELARLQRELEISDRAYRTMKEKYEQARLNEAEQVSELSIVDLATVPSNPISPNKNLNKLLGMIVGIMVGVILGFVLESFDTSIGTIEDVERTIHLPVIGIVPYFNPRVKPGPWWRIDKRVVDFFGQRMDVSPSPASLIMNQDSFSTLSESYRILRTFIEFIVEKKRGEGKVFLITSTGPQEGKTLTSCNLAISLAQAGKKTLLVDTDLRRPMVHRLFGLKRAPGLADILLGTASLEDVRRTMGDILVGESTHWDNVITTKMLDRLEIVATGTSTPTPAELLGSETMKRIITEARLRYEYIILDAPPVLPVTDARTLGPLSDATFFVYRAGKTARRALMRAKDELELAGVTVKGIILNHATPEVTLTDSYYYQYYGEDKSKK